MNNNSYLCKFIKENDDWRKRLSSYPFFINIKETGDLAIFNYSLTETDKIEEDGEEFVARIDFSLPEVQEARGIIINTKTLEVVCWPFRKFGNYGESYVDDIDWNSACVQEKVDGSIMKLWYDKRPDYNMWRISTNGVIDAYDCFVVYITEGDDCLIEEKKVFGQMFFDAAKKQNLDLSKLDFDNTYIFELVGPFNRVVVEYPEVMIYHTGTRNNYSGKEFDIDIGIQKPKRYKLSTLEDCIVAAEKLNITENNSKFNITQEGFVVVDKNFHRIKVKSPEYVAVHHALNNGVLSKKRAVEMILNGDYEEYITYFPKYKPLFTQIKKQMDKIEAVIEKYCIDTKNVFIRDNLSRKEFAQFFSGDKLFKYGVQYAVNNYSIKNIVNKMWKKHWVKWIEEIDTFDYEKENKGITNYVPVKQIDSGKMH